jgi:hypothetical protein
VPSQFVPKKNGSTPGLLRRQPRLATARRCATSRDTGAGENHGTEFRSRTFFRCRQRRRFSIAFEISQKWARYRRLSVARRIYNGRQYSLRNDKNAHLEIAASGAVATAARRLVRCRTDLQRVGAKKRDVVAETGERRPQRHAALDAPLIGLGESNGSAAELSPCVLGLQRSWGVPMGVHWYIWHKNPFDNDYPHFFAPKDDFAAGVQKLQANNVHVMPYINGRLWDTRDKGIEDFEYSRRAKAFATKVEKYRALAK